MTLQLAVAASKGTLQTSSRRADTPNRSIITFASGTVGARAEVRPGCPQLTRVEGRLRGQSGGGKGTRGGRGPTGEAKGKVALSLHRPLPSPPLPSAALAFAASTATSRRVPRCQTECLQRPLADSRASAAPFVFHRPFLLLLSSYRFLSLLRFIEMQTK